MNLKWDKTAETADKNNQIFDHQQTQLNIVSKNFISEVRALKIGVKHPSEISDY